jgi:rubrerythrin
MQKEKDAETFYRTLAQGGPTEGIRSIFTMLADTEVGHYRVLQQMKSSMPTVPNMSGPDEARQALFTLRQTAAANMPACDSRQVDAYTTARGLEQEAATFYAEQARNADSPEAAAIFTKLAGQEKMHYILIDNIIEFVTKPRQWVEDAEFSHILDKYRGSDLYPDGLDTP